MTRPSQFYCRVYKNGTIKIDVFILNKEHSLLRSFILNFPNIHEIKWIKAEINKELIKEGQTYTGQNTLKIGVSKHEIELSHNYDPENVQVIPTQVVLDLIDECIAFHEDYHAGGIASLIPKSKKDEWVIVPKEFVKDEYWLSIKNDDEEE